MSLLKTSPCENCLIDWRDRGANCEETCPDKLAVDELVEHAHEAADGIRKLHRITDADRIEIADYTCDGIRNAMADHGKADLDAEAFMAACGCHVRGAVAL